MTSVDQSSLINNIKNKYEDNKNSVNRSIVKVTKEKKHEAQFVIKSQCKKANKDLSKDKIFDRLSSLSRPFFKLGAAAAKALPPLVLGRHLGTSEGMTGACRCNDSDR